MNALELTLLYLLAAVLGVVVCRVLRLPAMLGYLAVGVIIGPNALALAQNSSSIRYLAEFGVVFLMFVIGLEFNLPKLRSMRQHVFGLGALQVALTMLIATSASLALAYVLPQYWQMSWQSALALGGALAMSSTAIVVKLMQERLELDSEHGKRVMGVLLFQDLAVVPLLVLVPALSASPDKLAMALGLAALKATFLIAILLTGGQRVMRWWLTLVARRKSEELFILNLLLITLGLAWLTEIMGLSLALGAFIAGMLISETEYKHQVETDIRPFHDVLLGLFFITIGMLLDWRIVWERWPLVLLLTLVPVVFKLVMIAALAKGLGASSGTSLRTGLYLAQAGEFGFVLLTLAQQSKLVSDAMLNPILASMVLSMLATPFIIMYSNRIVMKLVSSEWLAQSLQMTQIAKKSIGRDKHVIICGYGRCGQNLAKMLEREGIQYMALDLDPDRVRQAAAAGDSVVFGDAARLQAIMAAGLARAKEKAIRCVATDGAYATYTTIVPYMQRWIKIYSDRHLLQRVLPRWFYGLVGITGLNRVARNRGVTYPSVEKAASKLNRPLLMIHGGGDTYIKPEMAESLFARASGVKKLWMVPKAKHNQALHIAGEEYNRTVVEFFDRHLAREVAEPVPV